MFFTKIGCSSALRNLKMCIFGEKSSYTSAPLGISDSVFSKNAKKNFKNHSFPARIPVIGLRKDGTSQKGGSYLKPRAPTG